MNEEYTLKGYLGDEFQLKCLWQIITDEEFAEQIIPLLELSYFDDPNYKDFFFIIKKFREAYGRPPSLKDRSILIAIRKFCKKTEVARIETLDAVAVKIKNWNDLILNKEIPHDGLIIQKETLNFIKQQEYRKIASFILNGVKDGDNTVEFLYSIEEKVKKISEIGDEDDMGIEIMEDVQRALQKEYRRAIPTGIEAIDLVTKGGLGNSEIGIILAPSGVGKTTILSYIANTAYNHGYNVLQIIFEDSEDDIRRKHFSKWSKIPLSQIGDRKDEVYQRIVDWHNKNEHGKLVIKRFPQENTTIMTIKNYIDKYRKKHGVKFDMIVLDYIDILESHKKGGDQHSDELTIIKSFEAMSMEYNIPCWTAIQANRSAYGAELVEANQMGGNIKRAQKTHFLMSVAKTSQQKIDGQANIMILKARMAQDGQTFKDCIFDNDTMEISITDDLTDLRRKSLNLPKIGDDDIEKFNEKINALDNNNPDDIIQNEEKEGNVHKNLNNTLLNNPDEINKLLDNMT